MTHDFVPDPRNEHLQIHVNGDLVPRAEAKISVFDSGFLMGDGVWEGLRAHQGRVPWLDRHWNRLRENAAAIALDLQMDGADFAARIARVLRANDMRDGHVRFMVTRGIKSTPYQDPKVNVGPPTVVITAEHKEPPASAATEGLRLFTVHVRRGRPDVQDPAWNSHSKLNCIAACIQASQAGADEALMLDPQGFVATCNSVNFFCVRDGEVWTAPAKYLMPGITRGVTLELCRRHEIPCRELEFAVTSVYGADEAFVTGTFGGLTPVGEVDGRTIGDGRRGPVTERLQQLYAAEAKAVGVELA